LACAANTGRAHDRRTWTVALSIFTDMTNAGCSLQETLSAIYLSGLEHARQILAN